MPSIIIQAHLTDTVGSSPPLAPVRAVRGLRAGQAVRMLVSYGAEVTAKNPINWSVLLYACLGNHPEVVRWLVQQAGCKRATDSFEKEA